MPILRPDSIFQEWAFSEEEKIQARLLTPLQIQWYNTIFADLTKEKASTPIPTEGVDDRAYLMTMIGLDAQLNFITQMFQSHKEAITEMASRPNQITNPLANSDADIQARAASQVHNS